MMMFYFDAVSKKPNRASGLWKMKDLHYNGIHVVEWVRFDKELVKVRSFTHFSEIRYTVEVVRKNPFEVFSMAASDMEELKVIMAEFGFKYYDNED